MRETTFRSEQQYDRGRIRLNEHEAGEAYQALALRVGDLIEVRGEAIDAGLEGAAVFYNRKLSALRRLLGELERTIGEKGWDWAQGVVDAYREDAT